ncbi:hypothetical protein GPALN_002149 [Globodera pallida]|nr:hypothetical protein GPALN_002149 [Globodera pallida]
MEEEEAIVFEEALANLQFELDEKRRSTARGWKGIKEYYLSIPLMQLTEQARTLAKTFRKMLQNLYELYAAKKMDESNVGEDRSPDDRGETAAMQSVPERNESGKMTE